MRVSRQSPQRGHETLRGQRAIVVGAGLAGLTAAYRLQQAGAEVSVFEALPWTAGRARTVRLSDCIVDTGATVVLSAYTETLALIDELGLRSELDPVSGHCAIPRGGRMHLISLDHPLRSLLTTSLLSTGAKLSLLKLLPRLFALRRQFGFQVLGGGAGMDGETLADYCRRHLPAEAYDYLLNPTLKFLYLHNGEQGTLLELLWWMLAFGTGSARSFKHGTATLTDALAARLNVRCNSPVQQVTRVGSQAEVHVESGGELQTLRADYCLFTTPAPVTARLYHQEKPLAQDFLASRRYHRTLVATFCTRERPALDALMIQVPDQQTRALATIVFQHQVASARAPNDKGIVNAYFTGEWSERHFASDDQEIIRTARAIVRELVPEVDACEAAHVQRWEHTAAVPDIGDCSRVRQFVDTVDASSPVQVIGDYLVCASLNVAVATAERAVSQWCAVRSQSRPG